MKKTVLSALLLSALCASSVAWAAATLKPGLWEMTVKSDEMKKMPKIPPEQLEKMRKMGINMPNASDGGMAMKICMTKEMTESEQPPQSGPSASGCESKNYQRSGSGYTLDIVCDGPDMKGAGTVKGSYNGGESLNSTYDFKGAAHGHPINSHHETSGKWLSADCGSVKPIVVPKKK